MTISGQWGTFQKPASQPVALTMARKALSDQGYTVWLTNDDFNVIGGNSNVLVSVSCAGISNGTWVCVSAYSPDEPTAEAARNTVRQEIVSMVAFDDVP